MDEPANRIAQRALIVGTVQAAIWILLISAALFVAPRMMRTFMDFGVALPLLTQAAFKLVSLLGTYLYLAILAVVLWPFVNRTVVSLLGQQSVAYRRVWYILTWLAPLAFLAFVTLALLLPLLQLRIPLEPKPAHIKDQAALLIANPLPVAPFPPLY